MLYKILVLAAIAVLFVPAAVTLLVRRRLVDGPVADEAERRRRRGAVLWVSALVAVVAVMQATAGFAIAETASSLGGSDSPEPVPQVLHGIHGLMAAVPAAVLGVLLATALVRRSRHWLYLLGLAGNLTLAFTGVVLFYIVGIVGP